MSRITACMQALEKEGRKALIPYIVAGDPTPDFTVDMMHQLVKSGADIIELGVPFSDPMSEGPVIQLAHERALEHSVSLTGIIAMVKQFRQQNQTTPVVLMGYANPVMKMGYDNFANAALESDIDGLLTVDLPPEEADALNTALKRVEIDSIFLIAPTTTEERIKSIANLATGYLYYVSLKGVTGAGHLDIDSVKEKMAIIKAITDLPVAVGFGIKDNESAVSISRLAEGVVVGSALVNKVIEVAAAGEDNVAEQSSALITGMREAMDIA